MVANNEKLSIDDLQKIYKSIEKQKTQKYDSYKCFYDEKIDLILRDVSLNHLSDAQMKKYVKIVVKILKKIDDRIILENTKISVEYKVFMLRLKYNDSFYKQLSVENGKIYLNGECIYVVSNNKVSNVDIIEIKNNILKISGSIIFPFKETFYEVYFKDNKGNRHYPKFNNNFYKNYYALGNIVYTTRNYDLEIPLKGVKKLVFYINIMGKEIKLTSQYWKWAKISHIYKNSYYFKNNIVLFRDGKRLLIKKTKKRLNYEIRFVLELLKHKKIKEVLIRTIANIYRKVKNNKVWIITDRKFSADDSGELLFKYLSNKDLKGVNCYFILNKKSPDYKRVKKYGKVVKPNSFKHRILFLNSDIIISSLTNEWVINETSKYTYELKDFYNFKFVHIQHGVIKDDLSDILNKKRKNIKLFTTTSIEEYNSIINGNYGYTKDVVKLTGLGRFDSFYKAVKEKRIIIAPTWRYFVKGDSDVKKDIRSYNDDFVNTYFFNYFNRLINDKRIIDAMKKKGYTGEFVLHPMWEKQIDDFDYNDFFKKEHKERYKDKVCKSSLLITDYSSIAFDYAYMDVPVIYTQFDLDEFVKGHTYKPGYFDYEKDGFGPVCYNYDDTVKSIVDAINNDCKVDKKYIDRKNKYFKYFDNKNCERIYNEIIKID